MNHALQTRDNNSLAWVIGSYNRADEANLRMRWAVDNCHVITQATSIGELAEGLGLALSVVNIDTGHDGDTYPTDGGCLALTKSALQRCGHAAGLSWDPRHSGRQDDGSHPHYCRWRAVGFYKAFDGGVITLCEEKELDLRDGSPQAVEMLDCNRPKQLAQMRQHIQAHTETKAQLRVIRSLGIKTSYTPDELRKPFVAARVMFTGQSDDPETRRMFAQATAAAMLGGQRTLYGVPDPAPAAALPANNSGSREPQSPPPPLGSVPADRDDTPPPYDERPPANHAPQDYPPPLSQASHPAQDPRRNDRQATSSGHTIPGGRAKGTPIEDADDQDIKYWADRMRKGLADGSARNPQREQERVDAFEAELQRRK